MSNLKLANLTKRYNDAQGTETAVDDLSITFEDGELLVFVGPSGCGKSTTLRMIAGLESVTDGTVEIGGREVQDLAPSRRSIAMVFQSYALYTNMSVFENMEYGLKHSSDLGKNERGERVEDIAELLGIEELLDQVPADLSGGQKQRVALGRAIVREPEVFLLDEPLSNLDAKLRAHMRTELQRIHQRFGVTTVYVTHDQKEAMSMADRIAIMNDGVLQQVAPPEEAYDHPNNEFVATFLGSPAMNVVDATVEMDGDTADIVYDGQTLARLPEGDLADVPGDRVRVGLRPEYIVLHEDADRGTFTADVVVTEYQGKDNFVHLKVGERSMTARIPPDLTPQHGDVVGAEITPENVYLFDRESGDALKTAGTVSETTGTRSASTRTGESTQ